MQGNHSVGGDRGQRVGGNRRAALDADARFQPIRRLWAGLAASRGASSGGPGGPGLVAAGRADSCSGFVRPSASLRALAWRVKIRPDVAPQVWARAV